MEGDGFSSAGDQQTMIASFLEVALGQTADTARQFLQLNNENGDSYIQATGWKLEEAIQLFFVGNEFGHAPHIAPPENDVFMPDQNFGVAENHMGHENIQENEGSGIRAPLPVKRDILYDTPMYYRPSHEALHYEKLKRLEVWGKEQASTSASETSKDNLASLYCPPFALMYHGPFEKAKDAANEQDRWLLVNVQSTREFSSHMLNRDTWGNEAVAQTITSNFIFWQVCDDTEEGCKIMSYYKLDSVPATLVIDPITGQKMRLWRGMIQPESFLEDVVQYMDSSPMNHLLSLSRRHSRESSLASPPKLQDETNEDDDKMKLVQASSMRTLNDISEGFLKDPRDIKEVTKKEKRVYPPLPEEPKGDKSLLCRVGVRLPDGSRVQRNFLRSDPIQLLWSFCAAKCGNEKPFRLSHAIPGAVKDLDYDSMLTFADSGVANSMISVTWE
ncbi:putative UBX domain, Ubiquitin-like domain superfamily, Thioredoxin-like superfamily [Helianthus annuus]|nr:putative UBX domain, Ubiquitin-like domain superfamily, Thioredoxin-like superfamily [Helianthus annuus]